MHCLLITINHPRIVADNNKLSSIHTIPIYFIPIIQFFQVYDIFLHHIRSSLHHIIKISSTDDIFAKFTSESNSRKSIYESCFPSTLVFAGQSAIYNSLSDQMYDFMITVLFMSNGLHESGHISTGATISQILLPALSMLWNTME